MDVEPIIRGVDAHKVYNSGAVKVHALRGVNLAIPRGEMVAIMGPSGCGKTTLLNCFSGLDDLTSGDVLIEGVSLASMDDNAKSRYRSRRMGFVFQTYNLLPVLTAVENVELPLLVARVPAKEARRRALALSTAVMSASALRRASLAGTLATRRGSSTFSTAVNTGSRLYVWKTKPIRRERYRLFALSSIEASETPSMRTSPDVRSSRPEKQFRSVVLPQPDGPMIATISPRGIARFTPRRAWTLTAPELYTLWASTPRIIGSTSMRVVFDEPRYI